MQIIPLNLDSVLLFLHNSKLAYSTKLNTRVARDSEDTRQAEETRGEHRLDNST